MHLHSEKLDGLLFSLSNKKANSVTSQPGKSDGLRGSVRHDHLPCATLIIPLQVTRPGSKPPTVPCWQHSKIERETALTSCYGLLATLLSCIFQNSILLESATIDYSALKWLALLVHGALSRRSFLYGGHFQRRTIIYSDCEGLQWLLVDTLEYNGIIDRYTDLPLLLLCIVPDNGY